MREKVQWNAENWSKVIFLDEKKVQLKWTGWISVLLARLTKSGTNFQLAPVWRRIFDGAFSIKGKASLVEMDGKQNAQKYTEVLEKVSFHSWPIINRIMQYSRKITLRFARRSWQPNGSMTTLLLHWVGLQCLLTWIPSKISGVY